MIYKSKQILNVMNIMNDVDFANYFTIQILQCIFSVNDCQFSQFSALFDRFVPWTYVFAIVFVNATPDFYPIFAQTT